MNQLVPKAVIMGSLFSSGLGLAQTSGSVTHEFSRLDHSGGDVHASVIFRAQTDLSLLSFRFLPGKHIRPDALRIEDIQVLEDGVPRPIAALEGGAAHTTPTEVILLFDCSPSFRQFLNTRILRPGLLDELENFRISVYGFSDAVYRLIKPTRNMAEIQKAMNELRSVPSGGPVEDAVIQTIRSAAAVPGSHPRIMVVFSGSEQCLRMPLITAGETIRVARELGIALYPVSVVPQPTGTVDASVSGQRAARHPLPASRGVGGAEGFLSLGPATGGKSFALYTVPGAILQDVFHHVASQATGEYTTAFYPAPSLDPKPHDVQVVLKNKEQGEISGGFRILVH